MTEDVRMRWARFFWADWREDRKLRACSLAAKGLWIEMLALMGGDDEYGHLHSPEGGPMTADELALFVFAKTEDVQAALDELERRGVFSRTEQGVIYSRRMVRDGDQFAKFSEAGKRGGKPAHKPPSSPLKASLKRRTKPPTKPALYQTEAEADAEASAMLSPENASSQPPDARRTASAGAYAAGRAGGSRAAAAASGKRYPKPNADPTLIPSGKYNWEFALQICREDRIWDNSLGPRPGDPHCYVPPDLLLPGDGIGWADMTPKPEDKRKGR